MSITSAISISSRIRHNRYLHQWIACPSTSGLDGLGRLCCSLERMPNGNITVSHLITQTHAKKPASTNFTRGYFEWGLHVDICGPYTNEFLKLEHLGNSNPKHRSLHLRSFNASNGGPGMAPKLRQDSVRIQRFVPEMEDLRLPVPQSLQHRLGRVGPLQNLHAMV